MLPAEAGTTSRIEFVPSSCLISQAGSTNNSAKSYQPICSNESIRPSPQLGFLMLNSPLEPNEFKRKNFSQPVQILNQQTSRPNATSFYFSPSNGRLRGSKFPPVSTTLIFSAGA